MISVLLDVVNDPHMPHLFFVHVRANRVAMIFKNRLTSFADEINDQGQCFQHRFGKERMHKCWNTVLIMKAQLCEQRV